ncbi:MAG TPA: N-acetylmuramoyl-L-alanine amidase [Verrucomicrobiae bacterium]|nr:N-acetylmuramoyl-L-alanine amidase [Verrucomicrobiae bacterium]
MRAKVFVTFAFALVLALIVADSGSAAVSQDRELYLSAKKEYDAIIKSRVTPQARIRLEKVGARFEKLPQDYPKSAYADAAYYHAGVIYNEVYRSAKDQRALERSITDFRLLVSKYPKSAYAAESGYRLALALEEGKGEANAARHHYALVGAKYPQSDWGRKSRARLAALEAKLDGDKKEQSRPVTAVAKRAEKETPQAIVLSEKRNDPPQPKLAKPAPPGLRKIVIDPGHGGRDPGAVGIAGLAEKDIALAVARKLAARLKTEMGIEAILTRDDDRFVSLEERTAMANKQGADLFISLHVNASPNSEARGVETYYLDNTTDEAALRMAARENGIARDRISDLQFILSDMVQNLKLEDSITLAHRLQSSVVSQMGRRYGELRDLGVKKAQFYVLVGARMPSVLVEMFFITNNVEARALAGEDYQQTLADALFEGIKKYQDNAQVVKSL